MKLTIIGALGATIVLSGCGSVETCEEPEFYESAQAGKRIEAPDGLDGLAGYRELVIPEASPRPPRDRSAGCLDRPPTLRVDRPEDEEDEEDEEEG